MFLDEPTSGLDPISAEEFDVLIRTLQQTLGLTVFMVTHDLDSLYTVCDRIAVLADGKVVAEGPMSAMLASEHPWVKSYFRGKRSASVGDGGKLTAKLMETRAPYALIGLFVIAMITAVFGFVYWLHNTAGLGERTVYRVRFETPVSGLLTGAAVLFNGIRVGEVTNLRARSRRSQARDRDHRRQYDDAGACRYPGRAGFQGLTGVPVISLEVVPLRLHA